MFPKNTRFYPTKNQQLFVVGFTLIKNTLEKLLKLTGFDKSQMERV
jgi:hypothetical protein